MMTERLLTIVIVSISLLTACSKKGEKPTEPIPPPTTVAGKLAKVTYDAGAYDSLYYSNDGALVKLNAVLDPISGAGTRYTLEYNAAKKVQRIVTNDGDEYRYFYSDGQLSTVAHFVNGQKESYSIFTYQQNKLNSVEYFVAADPNAQSYKSMGFHTYDYYTDGNLKEEVAYSIHQLTGQPIKNITITYSDYDQGVNQDEIVRQVPLSYGLTISKNNAGLRSVKDEHTGSVVNFLFTYSYNSIKNPLTRSFQYFGSGNWHQGSSIYSYY